MTRSQQARFAVWLTVAVAGALIAYFYTALSYPLAGPEAAPALRILYSNHGAASLDTASVDLDLDPDERRALVEAAAGFVHRDREALVLATGETAAEAE